MIDSEKTIFYAYGGKKPNYVPICGYNGSFPNAVKYVFKGNNCPPNFVRDYLWIVIVGALIVCTTILAAVLAVYMSLRFGMRLCIKAIFILGKDHMNKNE